MEYYEALSSLYPGWTLSDIRNLSPRERNIWLEKGFSKVTRGV